MEKVNQKTFQNHLFPLQNAQKFLKIQLSPI